MEDDEEFTAESYNLSDHLGSPEAAFTNMLRYGILSLQLLPKNSSSGKNDIPSPHVSSLS